MSFVDSITKRGPGRPRKNPSADVAASGSTPVAAALKRPLPDGLEAAEKALIEAKRRLEQADSALTNANGPSGRAENERVLAKAQRALSDALVAVEMGNPDAPDEEALDRLKADCERAKADVDHAGARIESLKAHEERCYREWQAAHTAHEQVLLHWKKPLLEAVVAQLRKSAQDAAEAIGAARAVRTHELQSSYPTVDFPDYLTGGHILANRQIDLPAEINQAVATSRRNQSMPRIPLFGGSVISGTLDRRSE